MAKLQHRRVNIDKQLSAVSDMARLLRAEGAGPSLCEIVAALLESNQGPAPVVELFNWAHETAVADPTVEPLRDLLFELLRISGRIGRYYYHSEGRPDLPREPLDRCCVADCLDNIGARLTHELKHCHVFNVSRWAS